PDHSPAHLLPHTRHPAPTDPTADARPGVGHAVPRRRRRTLRPVLFRPVAAERPDVVVLQRPEGGRTAPGRPVDPRSQEAAGDLQGGAGADLERRAVDLPVEPGFLHGDEQPPGGRDGHTQREVGRAVRDLEVASDQTGPALAREDVSRQFAIAGGAMYQALDRVSFAVARGEFLAIV